MKPPRFTSFALSAVLAACALSEISRAASETWSGAASGNWSASGNWTGTNLPPVSGDAVIFTSAAGTGGLTLNNDLTSSAFTLAGITFSSGAGAYVIGDGTTAAGAGNAFVLGGNMTNSSTSLQTINDAFSMTATRTFTTTTGGGDLALTGLISGGGGIAKTGAGSTLTLTNTGNSFTGVVSVSAGTIQVSDSTVYGAGNQAITTTILGQAASNGVSFASNASVKILDLRYNGQNDGTAQTLQLQNKQGGNLLLNASSTNTTINVDRQGGTGTGKTLSFYNAVIANDAVLGATGAHDYALGLGTLSVGTGGAAGSITIAPTTANVTIGAVNNNGTGFAHTLILDGTSSGNTITGAMANNGAGVLSVTKQNASTWILSAVNTYTGATAINGGTLMIASTGTINGTSGIVIGAGVLNYTSSTALAAGVSFSGTGGTLRGNGTITPAVAITAGNTLAAGADAGTLGALVFGGGLTGSSGATFSLKLNSDTAGADEISAAGITLGGATLSLADIGAATLETGTFTILHSTSSSVAGTFAGLDEGASVAVGNNNYTISYLANGGQDVTLTVSAIPEPATWALLAGSLALAGVLWRRRARRSAEHTTAA